MLISTWLPKDVVLIRVGAYLRPDTYLRKYGIKSAVPGNVYINKIQGR